MSLLEFQNISYVNDNITNLKNVTISISQGDYISVAGPSGSGNITFLKLYSHLISPTTGNILYYCFQAPNLFGESVMDNISFHIS